MQRELGQFTAKQASRILQSSDRLKMFHQLFVLFFIWAVLTSPLFLFEEYHKVCLYGGT